MGVNRYLRLHMFKTELSIPHTLHTCSISLASPLSIQLSKSRTLASCLLRPLFAHPHHHCISELELQNMSPIPPIAVTCPHVHPVQSHGHLSLVSGNTFPTSLPTSALAQPQSGLDSVADGIFLQSKGCHATRWLQSPPVTFHGSLNRPDALPRATSVLICLLPGHHHGPHHSLPGSGFCTPLATWLCFEHCQSMSTLGCFLWDHPPPDRSFPCLFIWGSA